VNEREREQLQKELAANREALLGVVCGADVRDLTLPTRNPDWTVRVVISHVLASDADLIALLQEAGRSETRPLPVQSLEQHEGEMARWSDATPQAMADELRDRGDRWRELLAALPDPAFAISVSAPWSDGVRELWDVVGDWRPHDAQHAEDVRLALAGGGSGGSG
jgi:hypothetical protein